MYLFCFGYGYVADFLAKELSSVGWKIAGTSRDDEKIIKFNLLNYNVPIHVDVFRDVTHVLISIPPHGDDVLSKYRNYFNNLRWVGYLSATNVYGDHGGKYVNEKSLTNPIGERAVMRLNMENEWLNTGLPVHIFRLAAIYGPKRNVLYDLVRGVAKNIVSDHVFSRIHVEDIVSVLTHSIKKPNSKSIYNCSDDLPATHHEVLSYGSKILNIDLPEPIKVSQLSEFGQSFFLGKKLIDNSKIKTELNVLLKYSNYIKGLDYLFDTCY